MAAIDGPAGPSMATKSAMDGPAGPVVAGDHLRRDKAIQSRQCASYPLQKVCLKKETTGVIKSRYSARLS